LWTPAATLSDPTVSDPVASPTKTTTYTLFVKDGNGCSSLIPKTVTVEVTPPIKVNTYPTDTIVYEGDKLTLLATSIATNYVWSPSTGLSDPLVANPLFTAGAAGQVVLFKVTAITAAGCTGEALVQVKVYKGPELYTPTAFTPNGDRKNDYFFPFPVGIKELNYFRVYNRWGQIMFSTKTLNDGWDGRLGGKIQDAGVYVWMAEGKTLDGRIITRKGTVTLIR
jgi:gliding motility-associated-like protein